MIKYFDNSDKSITFVKWNFCENDDERFAALQKPDDKIFLSFASVTTSKLQGAAQSYAHRNGYRVSCKAGILDGFVGVLVRRLNPWE